MEALLNRKGSTGTGARGWATAKTKMNIPTPSQTKGPEIEFRNVAMKLMRKKSEAQIEAMEKQMKKKPEPRKRTEYEIMKEKLRHVEFSDEEQGFLTKEQMEDISAKLAETKKLLMELEREGKGKGRLLADYIADFPEWAEDLAFLNNSGLPVDLDSLMQARKRAIISKLFYDPKEAEKRAQMAEEAARLKAEREAELEAKRREAEEKRLAALELEKKRLQAEKEAKERELAETEQQRLAERLREEEELKEYAEQEKRRLQLEDFRRNQQEQENKAKREQMMRKFSVTEGPDRDDIDVGKLNFDGLEQKDVKSRRRSVGKLENPWEKIAASGQPKQRSRRASKVGKLNSPYESGSTPWSKANSRETSRKSSRESSRRNSTTEDASDLPVTTQPEFLQALAGLEDLAKMASRYDEYDE